VKMPLAILPVESYFLAAKEPPVAWRPPCQSLVLAWSLQMTLARFSNGESARTKRLLPSTCSRPERARVARVMALEMVEVWP